MQCRLHSKEKNIRVYGRILSDFSQKGLDKHSNNIYINPVLREFYHTKFQSAPKEVILLARENFLFRGLGQKNLVTNYSPKH